MVTMKWQTMAEYARQKGISREAVRQAVNSGRIEHNGKTGRECRVRGEMAESARVTVTPSKEKNSELAKAKLEKLRTDIEIQKLRIRENRETVFREFADFVAEEYLRSFAPVKVKLTALRLDAAKLAALRKLIEECTADFIAALRKKVSDGCD